MTKLSINDLHVDRGGIPIIRGVDFHAAGGEISVLLGSNGAGKTTLLESLSGIIPVKSGAIGLNDDMLTRMRPGARADNHHQCELSRVDEERVKQQRPDDIELFFDAQRPGMQEGFGESAGVEVAAGRPEKYVGQRAQCID